MRGPEQFTRLRTPQLRYLQAGDRRADLIGRTESFGDDLARICERLGLEPPAQESRRNAQPGAPSSSYREHFTPAMRDRVAELFAADVDEFGYEF